MQQEVWEGNHFHDPHLGVSLRSWSWLLIPLQLLFFEFWPSIGVFEALFPFFSLESSFSLLFSPVLPFRIFFRRFFSPNSIFSWWVSQSFGKSWVPLPKKPKSDFPLWPLLLTFFSSKLWIELPSIRICCIWPALFWYFQLFPILQSSLFYYNRVN